MIFYILHSIQQMDFLERPLNSLPIVTQEYDKLVAYYLRLPKKERNYYSVWYELVFFK